VIDENKPNPYAPSAITIKFAIASSLRNIALKAGGRSAELLTRIKATTYEMSQSDANTVLELWDEISAKASADFEERDIITGNILQAYLGFSQLGKLVSYTTADGSIKKGILLRNRYDSKDQKRITVPLNKAIKIMTGLMPGQVLDATAGFSFIRQGEDFKIVVPGSKAKGGHIFLDQELIDLTREGTFNKQGDKMIAMIDLADIEQFVEVATQNHRPTVDLKPEQFEIIKDDIESYQPAPDIALPQRPEQKQAAMPATDNDEMEMMEMEAEAEALELELELLEIKIAA
jgi:hypothetical protein